MLKWIVIIALAGPILSQAARTTAIDRPLINQYQAEGITPAPSCSDATFIRRVYLDVTGTLPTVDQVKAFLNTNGSKKRATLIDSLLASDEFSTYTTLRWCDRLRVKSEFPINLWPNAVQAYHHWILASVRANKPYDQFVREILTSNGSNFRAPPVNFFRAVQNNDPASLAQATALTFMGCRIDAWSQAQRDNLAAFFAELRFNKTGEWKEEIVYADLFTQSSGRSEQLTLPDGSTVTVPLHMDARAALADWLTQPNNPWFAKNAVNLIWHQLFGTGLIQQPDDIRPDNPPINAELLALLEKEFVQSDYDARHIYRLILNSATYQRDCIPATDTPEAMRLYAHYPLRRLDAETLIDAICAITGVPEEYWSVIPEPFTFMPVQDGSVSLTDGSITSPFLEKFGRPARDTGLASERNNDLSAAQMLHLLNSGHIRAKLEGTDPSSRSPARRNRQSDIQARPVQTNATELYYQILSRPPTDEERAIIRTCSLADLKWALINSPEFLFKH